MMVIPEKLKYFFYILLDNSYQAKTHTNDERTNKKNGVLQTS
jgi:hypothetical protein